jgi:hypothetical protein
LIRLRIFALFAALIALTATLAACGGGGGSDDPKQVVSEATLQGIESGNLDLSVGIKSQGQKSSDVDISVSGPFQSEEGKQPELALLAKASGTAGGEDIDREGGLTLLGDRAFVNYEGTEYAVDPTTYGFVKSMIQSRTGGQGEAGESAACQDAVGKLEVDDFVDNLRSAGDADVGGTSTTKVSGDLNLGGAVEALSDIVEDPACREDLKAAGSLPSVARLNQAKSELQQSVKAAHVDLYVGDDHIVRRISIEATIEPSAPSKATRKADLDIDLQLTGVNEDQEIPIPSSAKPLSSLFVKLGINPLELLGALRSPGGLAGSLGPLLEKIGGVGGNAASDQHSECLRNATGVVELQRCMGLPQ